MKKYEKYKDSGVEWIGEIPEHWEVLKISRLFSSISSGTTPLTDNSEYYSDNGENWLQTGDLNDGYITSTKKRITLKAIKEKGMKIYPKGSLVIAMYGATIGKLGILDIETTTNQACCVLYNGLGVLNKFMFYALLSSKEMLLSNSNGGGQPNISQGTIREHLLTKPTLLEQQQISDYLDDKVGKIDKILADKNKMIDDLKDYKMSLISEVVTKGLDKNVNMKDSGVEWIGEISEHWDVCKFKRSMTINNGKDYKDIASDVGFPVIGSGGQFAFASKYLYDGEALLLGRKGTVDKPKYINDKFWTVDTMFYAIPKDNTFCKYMYYQFLNFPFQMYSTETAVPSMTQTDFNNSFISLPPISEQQQIADYLDEKVGKIDEILSEIDVEIKNLGKYKQSIITEAVTGKIDVRE